MLTIKNGSSQFFSFTGADFENLCVNFFQQKILAKSKIKEFWPHSFTTFRSPLYYNHIVMLNEAVARISPCF